MSTAIITQATANLAKANSQPVIVSPVSRLQISFTSSQELSDAQKVLLKYGINMPTLIVPGVEETKAEVFVESIAGISLSVLQWCQIFDKFWPNLGYSVVAQEIHKQEDCRSISLPTLAVASLVHYVSGSQSSSGQRKRSASVNKMDHPISTIIERSRMFSKPDVRRFDWEVAQDQVTVLRDFITGTRVLSFAELLGLASNFILIRGGQQVFKDTLDKHGYPGIYLRLLGIVKSVGLPAIELRLFSPHLEDQVFRTLIEAGKPEKTVVVRKQEYPVKNLQEVQQEFLLQLSEVKESDDTLIHIFRVDTGVGKTEAVLEWENVLVAFPSHQLKDAVSARFRVYHTVSPEVPDFEDKSLCDSIEFYHSIGAHDKARNLIVSASSRIDYAYRLSPSDGIKATEYLRKLRRAYSTEETVLTTHQRAMKGYSHRTIVFDEDPLSSAILPTKETTIADLSILPILATNSADKRVLMSLQQMAVSAPPNMLINMPQFFLNDREGLVQNVIAKAKVSTAVLDFLQADSFMLTEQGIGNILFIQKAELPVNKKIIILSATADEFIYRKLYGDRVRFYDTGRVELQGKLTQDMRYTYSRQNLGKAEVLSHAKERSTDRLAITFAAYAAQFPLAIKDVYFGKCQGIDSYTGRPLIVIGTPHLTPSSYLLLAQALGVTISNRDLEMGLFPVEKDGLFFRFFTFKHPDLRRIQFYFIETELRQAIGRARLQRNKDADVLLLSNYPLPESQQFIN